jgi:ribosomal protein S18 acetylase RimI-like enzyme
MLFSHHPYYDMPSPSPLDRFPRRSLVFRHRLVIRITETTKDNLMVSVSSPQTGLADVCAPILRALPEWFGREEANQHYIAFIEDNPTLLATVDSHPAGFLTLAQHYPESAEIYVMGVLPDQHRSGIGRALVAAAEAYLKAKGTRFLQVKTLGAAHPDAGYQRTRLFYLGVGFTPLEEFEDLWGDIPALQLIKYLG